MLIATGKAMQTKKGVEASSRQREGKLTPPKEQKNAGVGGGNHKGSR